MSKHEDSLKLYRALKENKEWNTAFLAVSIGILAFFIVLWFFIGFIHIGKEDSYSIESALLFVGLSLFFDFMLSAVWYLRFRSIGSKWDCRNHLISIWKQIGIGLATFFAVVGVVKLAFFLNTLPSIFFNLLALALWFGGAFLILVLGGVYVFSIDDNSIFAKKK